MQTTKERAEAYVRSKIPELMALSFGCEVITNSGVHTRMVRPGGFKKVLGRKVWMENGYDYTCDEFEIIGHPIALHHWLRVLPKKNLSISATAHFLYLDYKGDRGMTFDLVTGQPDSEPSYKNFLTIVGEDLTK